MYVGNKTALVKGTCSHNGTWEHITGYKFIGLLERSMEMPVALLLQTVQAAKIYCACFHALACKRITCQDGTLTLPPLPGIIEIGRAHV